MLVIILIYIGTAFHFEISCDIALETDHQIHNPMTVRTVRSDHSHYTNLSGILMLFIDFFHSRLHKQSVSLHLV